MKNVESTNITDAKIDTGLNVIIFDWRKLTFSDKLDVEMSIWNDNEDEIINLLPPTE